MNEIQDKEIYQGLNKLYANVSEILANARKRAYTAVNFAMVESYWLIGQQIVEHEQHGEARADYGKGLLKELAARLTTDFGKGFDERELRKMRQFYQTFPKRDTLRPELTWSHYRRLISVENEAARLWYMNEAADSVWSTRQMDSYIRMWDALYKNEDDNPTLGIILCSQKSEAIVKYSVLSEGKQLFASRYKLYLPTEEEFKRMLESIE